jgi:hypothetical protein
VSQFWKRSRARFAYVTVSSRRQRAYPICRLSHGTRDRPLFPTPPTMPSSADQPGEIRCAFCGRSPRASRVVPDSPAYDIDCEMCGEYRISRDRETRMLRKQFTRRARAAQLAEIRSANAQGLRYSVDDGRPVSEEDPV